MSDRDEDKPVELKGQAAVDLWKKGKDAWNAWIDAHPGATISFYGIDFSLIRQALTGSHGYTPISFDGYRFGDGGVTFEETKFGDGDVSFVRTRFGSGTVSFNESMFGDGDIMFDFSQFAGTLAFAPTRIGAGKFSFAGASVTGLAMFGADEGMQKLSAFDLQASAFHGPLELTGAFNCIPDLCATRTTHHVELGGVSCTLKRKPVWKRLPWLLKGAEGKDDAIRLRRLKELAEANRDHAAALRFAADENRANRWHEGLSTVPGSILDILYSASSDYGQSILRPTIGLGGLTLLSALGFWGASDRWSLGCFSDALSLSLANTVAFLPVSRAIRVDAQEALFGVGVDPGLLIDLMMIAQASLSFVFLFLIGLGLRNRFRL